ncbi:MAG: PRD domain-containing protein [Solobacterium sp.]|nr:PRD domain-containing protein [Solobacterium sp.]
MRVIRCINNNVAVCLDANGQELVAFGKGIGFKKPPFDVPLSQVERTFYNVEPSFISMINDIPDEVLKISDEIIDYAGMIIDKPFSANIVFTLADHLNFCIQRIQKNLNVKLPITHDIEQLFEKEVKVGNYGRDLIRDRMGIWLPKEEAAYIALHLINYEEQEKNSKDEKQEEAIEQAVAMIEQEFDLKVNRQDFNYSRFVSHMYYFFKRGEKKELIQTENEKMYQTLVESYPRTYKVSEQIAGYLKEKMDLELTDEEKMYLMLHINRLSTREDCYR